MAKHFEDRYFINAVDKNLFLDAVPTVNVQGVICNITNKSQASLQVIFTNLAGR